MRAALLGPSLSVEDAFLHPSEYLLDRSGGNTGNFAYIRGLRDTIGGEFTLFTWGARPEEIRERSDVVVLACANQLGPHTDLGDFGRHLENIGLPILAFGLGAQSDSFDQKVELTNGTKRWVEVLAAHCPAKSPNIGVRGEFSRQQLENLGFQDNVCVTGCPSNFINTDINFTGILAEKYKLKSVSRIAVAAGLPFWPALRRVEQELANIVEETRGVYVVQHEINMIRIARGEFDAIEPSLLRAMNAYIRPMLPLDEFLVWCGRYATCFIDSSSWMEALRNFDFVVGPRFHGVMLGIQAGTPGGVIAHDARTLELCQTMCIPVRHHGELEASVTVETVRSLFNFDADAYSRCRSELGGRYVKMLESAQLVPTQGLLGLLGPELVAAEG